VTDAQRLQEMRLQTGLNKDFAIAQFVAYFGELDNAPKYTYDGSMPLHGTHAFLELMKFKDELDPALLKEALSRILSTKPIESSDQSYARTDDQYSVLPATSSALSLAQRQSNDDHYRAIIDEIVDDFEIRLNRKLTLGIELLRVPTKQTLYPNSNTEALMLAIDPAYTNAVLEASELEMSDLGLKSTENCWLVIVEGSTENNLDSLEEFQQKATLAHEVMHCFQFV